MRLGFTAALLLGALSVPAHAVETITYVYDALGRVVQVVRNGTVVTTYSYDKAGNRTELKVVT